ncbi:MAG: DUF362 domain-containing protein [Candidatus Nezhaarchaeales archaeon]|nr:MAG: 4Fe-4S ferredoxin [Candidatus Nezhaarchaeota archaeon WYZ-LMO8]TDA37347.1 MAG: 4Fe-4S ferredoxin [Candidatus Nezhaarchaeota archaeon WYZ-LMO7]
MVGKVKVYFYDFRDKEMPRVERAIEKLLRRVVEEEPLRGIVGIKVHMGEEGNITHLRPEFVRSVVDVVKRLGCEPIVFDTTSLYSGPRSNAVSYLNLAAKKGFTYASLGAPVVIGDGIRGMSGFTVKIQGFELSEVEVADIVRDLDSMIVLSHFKGHVTAGFGGALKNLAMGCTTKRGKASQHRAHMPIVLIEKCVGCGSCSRVCSYGAIRVEEKVAKVNYDNCVGCLECYFTCPNRALDVPRQGIEKLQVRLADAALAVIKALKSRPLYLNVVINVTARCDCLGCVMKPIVNDVGLLSSLDPVAMDQASLDLVVETAGGRDPFLEVNGVSGERILEAAEKLGLGSRTYELVKIG